MFITHQPEDIVILQGEYSLSIVLLSVVIAFLASFTALSLNERIRKNGFFSRNFWLILASIAMGMGIWAMHFIGMSAFRLPVSMQYNLTDTILSVFPAVMASYLAFYISNRTNSTRWPQVIAGITMGIGIALMHYVGMSAMVMDIEYAYRPFPFILSILIAILVSYVALYIFTSLQKFMGNFFVKLNTSLLMGIAVASMHYTGMEAVVFYTEGEAIPAASHEHHMNYRMLIVSVTLGIGVILGLSGLSSLLDRYVDFRLNHFDSLTGLPNRRQFEKLLTVSAPVSLSIIHIHGLEKWNRRYGYEVGDEVIRAVSDILIKLKPAVCMLYRIEGNRFALVLEDERDNEALKIPLKRIMAIMEKPLIINEKKLVIEMVCTVASSEGNDRTEVFANTMAVIQHSNTAFNHEVIEYDSKIHTLAFERNLIQDLDRAMQEDELYVLYQPKVCSSTRVVFGVEALLRWKHPVHGVISPGIFIPILEENGKMHEVTDWLIDHVCQQIMSWKSRDLPIYKVAINIPGSYFTSPHLMKTLKQSVTEYGIDSKYLELEITETSVIDQIEDAIKAVGAFKEYGFTVALDDFGTGVSSLSYLKRLPISTMKIDKSFVDDVPQSEKDSAIMKAIISLGHSLKLKVVIEGVENEEQMKFLSSNSENPIIQGYYYSKPLDPKELVDWVNGFNELAV
jgi:diguanylate cyclase